MSLLQDMAYYLTIKPRLMYLRTKLPGYKILPAGSRYVCDPPRWLTDIDFLIYGEKHPRTQLHLMGYVETPWITYSGIEDRNFSAWRRGSVNLIVTTSRKYAESFDTATFISKKYNLRKKVQRVFVHEVLRGGYKQTEIENERIQHDGRTYIKNHGELLDLMSGFAGPYGHALMKAYRAKHGLEEFT